MIRPCAVRVLACVAAMYSGAASAVPIVISNAGYWLETIGTNTIGLAGGGLPSGINTTLFVANTSPDPNTIAAPTQTTAAATQNGLSVSPPTFDSTGLWAKRVLNPVASQLTPLTVTFANGPDTVDFIGRDLSGLSAMPLVSALQANGAANPSSPLISWTLPTAAAAGDVDLVQLVFYNNATDTEVGTRVTLAPTATSFQIGATLPAGLDLVVNVRLVDLFDDNAAFASSNIQRESRAYVNYLTPVPEPAAAGMMLLGLVGLGWAARQRRGGVA